MKTQTLQNTIKTDDSILTPITSRDRTAWNRKLSGLAQWCLNKGLPCIIEHETSSLIVYRDSVGRKFRRPTFNQIHEHVTGESFIKESL